MLWMMFLIPSSSVDSPQGMNRPQKKSARRRRITQREGRRTSEPRGRRSAPGRTPSCRATSERSPSRPLGPAQRDLGASCGSPGPRGPRGIREPPGRPRSLPVILPGAVTVERHAVPIRGLSLRLTGAPARDGQALSRCQISHSHEESVADAQNEDEPRPGTGTRLEGGTSRSHFFAAWKAPRERPK